MPTEPRISVRDYVIARLDEQDEHFERKNALREQRLVMETRETRAWFLFLSAPAWTDLINAWTTHEIAVAVGILFAIFGLLGIAFYRTKKPVSKI